MMNKVYWYTTVEPGVETEFLIYGERKVSNNCCFLLSELSAWKHFYDEMIKVLDLDSWQEPELSSSPSIEEYKEIITKNNFFKNAEINEIEIW